MAAVTIIIWSAITSFLVLKFIDLTIGLRLTLEQELLGADYCEHNVELPPELREYADSVLRTLKEQAEEAKDNNSSNVQRDDQDISPPQIQFDSVNDGEDLMAPNLNSSDDESDDNDDQIHKKCGEIINGRNLGRCKRVRIANIGDTLDDGYCNPVFAD